MTKRLIFSSIAMLTLMAAPAQAANTASAQAKVSISITDLVLEPGLLAYWGFADKISAGGGTGTGGGSADYGFMGGTGFWASVDALAQASAPPDTDWYLYSSVSSTGPLIEISNLAAVAKTFSLVANGQIGLSAVALGSSMAYVSGDYTIYGYCPVCTPDPLIFSFSAGDWFLVGGLANEPEGPRFFNDSRSDSFSFAVPAGATLFVAFNSTAQGFAQAQTVGEAVPEPGTWAMLVTGFGLVGGVLRRRRLQLS